MPILSSFDCNSSAAFFAAISFFLLDAPHFDLVLDLEETRAFRIREEVFEGRFDRGAFGDLANGAFSPLFPADFIVPMKD